MSKDFGAILGSWEEKEKQGKKALAKAESEKKLSWVQALDKVPPRSEDLELKNGEERLVPASTKVQRRQHPIQDELDLHGLKGKEAQVALDSFLEKCRGKGLKKVRIIHGRGLHSPGDAVLKPLVQTWATGLKGVKWEVCAPQEGGPGALWLWLGP